MVLAKWEIKRQWTMMKEAHGNNGKQTGGDGPGPPGDQLCLKCNQYNAGA
jgi:hypothetical protein